VPTDVYKKDLGHFGEELYFAEDNAEELALKIERVLSWSEEKRAEYASISRKLVVEKHNIENVAEKIVKLLKK
jgi:glycosyltransferase involved in cell wall biosynthesis